MDTNLIGEPSPTDSPAIRVADLTKQYGHYTALGGVTFDVPTGQKIAVIGPSGSGKTTLLRILMTLEKPELGRVEIEGEPLILDSGPMRGRRQRARQVHAVRGKIGMIFQQFNLFPHMSVMRNVTEAPVRVLGLSVDEARHRAEELLEMVGLLAKANARPRELSGGQQQRVAIARALAMRPQIMLFDEVTSALDPELTGEVLKVIRMLATETSMTMLLVTHEMSFARDISDRVLFMDGGTIIEDDSPEVIFSAPNQKRTQDFLKAFQEAQRGFG